MRLFIAIELSDEVRRTLGGLIEELRGHRAPVKWVELQNIHLTLKFLGETPEAKMDAVVAALRLCAREVAPFRLDIKGAGGFPSLRRPRVVFADAQDSPPAAAMLAGRLDEEMAKLGFERETRPFVRHITIGRVKAPGPLGRMTAALEQLAAKNFGTMTVGEAALIKSELTAAGPIYTRVGRAELSGRAAEA